VTLDPIAIASLPRWLLELAFVAYLAVGIGLVVLEQRQPRTTLTWVLAIVFMPFLGVGLYWLLGRRPYRRQRRRSRRAWEARVEALRQISRPDELPVELSPIARGLVRLALRSATAPLQRAHRVQLLAAGERAWSAIREAVETARESIHLEFYIWRDDEAGRALSELLARRAREGVAVRVLLDALGSLGLPASHLAPVVAAGGEVETFAPIWLPSLQPRANFRNHRKLICVDQRVGFVGGLNVGNEYLGFGTQPEQWQDLLVRMEGPAVDALETVFAGDWIEAGGASLEGPSGVWGREPHEAEGRGALVQIIPSGPDVQHVDAIAAQLTTAIASALERCWIATPYLVPDEPLMLALKTAALRGVDLRLLVPGRSDLRLVHYASRSYYDELLDAGCGIFELPQMLHSKYLVVDDALAAIGSANMDIRSFYLNYEVTAMFYDAEVTADLAENFLRDLVRARPVGARDRAGISGAKRLAESAARVMSPLL